MGTRVMVMGVPGKRKTEAEVDGQLKEDVTMRSCVIHSFWPAFTLTAHINALYNESVQRQEQHSIGINTIT